MFHTSQPIRKKRKNKKKLYCKNKKKKKVQGKDLTCDLYLNRGGEDILTLTYGQFKLANADKYFLNLLYGKKLKEKKSTAAAIATLQSHGTTDHGSDLELVSISEYSLVTGGQSITSAIHLCIHHPCLHPSACESPQSPQRPCRPANNHRSIYHHHPKHIKEYLVTLFAFQSEDQDLAAKRRGRPSDSYTCFDHF